MTWQSSWRFVVVQMVQNADEICVETIKFKLEEDPPAMTGHDRFTKKPDREISLRIPHQRPISFDLDPSAGTWI
jgi:hypothetical protein